MLKLGSGDASAVSASLIVLKCLRHHNGTVYVAFLLNFKQLAIFPPITKM